MAVDRAQAAASEDNRVYGGVGVGLSQLHLVEDSSDWRVSDGQDATYRLFLGYQLTEHWFAELGYSDLGNATVAPYDSTQGQARSISYKVPSISAGYLLPGPGERYDVFFRLGAAALINGSTGENKLFQQSTSSQWLAGLGGKWRWSDNLSLRVEAVSYGADAQSYTLSLAYSAGGAPAAVRTNPEQVAPSEESPGDEQFELELLFAAGSDQIEPSYLRELTRLAKVAHKYPDTQILIEGHADDPGNAEANHLLSQRRALAVAAVLQDQLGVDLDRITSIGYGATKRVVAPSQTQERRQNRRVVVSLVR